MHDLEYFSLFSNCIPISGIKNAAIYDLQNHELIIIPVDVIPILEKIKTLTQSEYKNYFDDQTLLVLNKYINFFVKNELGFWSKNPEWFLPISTEWDFPSIVTNAIIEITDDVFIAEESIKQLDDLNCKALELRIIGLRPIEIMNEVLKYTKETSIQFIQVIIKALSIEDSTCWFSMMKENPRLHDIYIYNSVSPKREKITMNKFVNYNCEDFNNTCCGKIDKKYFSVNIQSYTESLQNNSCLNRKVCIDTKGNIKNCPSMTESFGNIKNITLAKTIENSELTKKWRIAKDEILICKNCEFRYICTDCRAYLEDPENVFSKPLKCGYDPCTGEWSEWSNNPLKQKIFKSYHKDKLN